MVYKLSKPGQQTVLYTFTNGSDGANPVGNLVRDSVGNLYGTTKLGGKGFGSSSMWVLLVVRPPFTGSREAMTALGRSHVWSVISQANFAASPLSAAAHPKAPCSSFRILQLR